MELSELLGIGTSVPPPPATQAWGFTKAVPSFIFQVPALLGS